MSVRRDPSGGRAGHRDQGLLARRLPGSRRGRCGAGRAHAAQHHRARGGEEAGQGGARADRRVPGRHEGGLRARVRSGRDGSRTAQGNHRRLAAQLGGRGPQRPRAGQQDAARHHRHRGTEGERRGRGRQDRRVPRHRAGDVRPRRHLRRPMSEPTNGGRMTSLDAAFYYLERTGQLLHVGGVYTVEGAIDFERLLTDLAGRMHLSPRYTERVVSVPLNLAHPTWEPDPQFDIRHHVLHHKLRPPGGDEQLVTLVSRLFAQPLKRSRPLWELHQIDGYRGDRSVIFAKVHHCMVDGVSGVQLLGVMLDASPNPAPVPPPEGVREAPPLPTPTAQLVRAVREGVQDGLARVQAVADLVRDPRRALAELGHAVHAVAELGRMVLSDVPSTPFNGHVSILRRIVWTTFSLNEVKAVKDRLGGTVNDVVLSTISAALRTYLE